MEETNIEFGRKNKKGESKNVANYNLGRHFVFFHALISGDSFWPTLHKREKERESQMFRFIYKVKVFFCGDRYVLIKWNKFFIILIMLTMILSINH